MTKILKKPEILTKNDDDRYWLNEFIYNKNIRIFMQPIVNVVENRNFAYESLCRGPVGSPYEIKTPFILTDKYKLSHALDEPVLYKTLEFFRENPSIGPKYFVNILIENLDIIEGFELNQFEKETIIFEINLSLYPYDVNSLFMHLVKYKKQGVLFAIDDIGEKKFDFGLIKDIDPYIYKIDIKLIRNIDKKPENQKLVSKIVEHANKYNKEIIAEGVERVEELRVIKELEIKYVQGFYFSKPMPANDALEKEVTKIIRKLAA